MYEYRYDKFHLFYLLYTDILELNSVLIQDEGKYYTFVCKKSVMFNMI